MAVRAVAAVAALLALGLAGCSGGLEGLAPLPAGQLMLSSPAFAPDGEIPAEHTCEGAGTSPPLSWSGVPDQARSLALVVEDPDAPRGTFVHWVVADLPVEAGGTDPGALPAGALVGENSSAGRAWYPPCPPEGDEPHRYVFTLYAFADPPDLGDPPRAATLREAAASALAAGRLVGRFAR